jgi:deoxyribodipyrimidine photolyase-related protein
MRHEKLLAGNARMALQVKNVARMSEAERESVVRRADAIRQGRVGSSA